jgi:phage baseplate assembly protein V
MRGAGHLQNAMRLQAMMQYSGRAQTRYGLVSSFDPDRYCAKVTLQPSGKETGWLPVGTPWAGNGWGFFAPPPIGAQVKIEFPEGVTDVGVVTLSFYNDDDRPLSVPSGEIWLVHQTGASIKLTNAGNVEVEVKDGQFIVKGKSEFQDDVAMDAALTVIGETSFGGGAKRVALDQDMVVGGMIISSATTIKAT